MVNAPESSQPFILVRLIKWVLGTPGDLVVKKCPSTGFIWGMRESLQDKKIWLIFPCSLNGCSRKCLVCSFHAVFGHISQYVSPLPLQLISNRKFCIWSSSWYHGFITQIFGETNNGRHHKIRKYCYVAFISK